MGNAIIFMTKIDPAQTRFYILNVQSLLFGDWSLVKEWGRIGLAGQQCIAGLKSAATLTVRSRAAGYAIRPLRW